MSCPVRARGLKFVICMSIVAFALSCPVRARGLKYHGKNYRKHTNCVVPRAGTWIEMLINVFLFHVMKSRAPCGHVD